MGAGQSSILLPFTGGVPNTVNRRLMLFSKKLAIVQTAGGRKAMLGAYS